MSNESEAEILYKKNCLLPITSEESRKARDLSKEDAERQTQLYEEIGMGLEPVEKVQIEEEYFEREWVQLETMQKPEDIEKRKIFFKRIWDTFNQYSKNPLSAQNQPGEEDEQPILKENNVDHTSMSIGDIIKYKDTFYIACAAGWAEIEVIDNE